VIAEIVAGAEEDADDYFEIVGAVTWQAALLLAAPQGSQIALDHIAHVIAKRLGRKRFGLVEDAVEFRSIGQEIEERTEADLLAFEIDWVIGDAAANPVQQLRSQLREKPVEQILLRFEIIVERALGDTSARRDLGDRGVAITFPPDDLGHGVHLLAARCGKLVGAPLA